MPLPLGAALPLPWRRVVLVSLWWVITVAVRPHASLHLLPQSSQFDSIAEVLRYAEEQQQAAADLAKGPGKAAQRLPQPPQAAVQRSLSLHLARIDLGNLFDAGIQAFRHPVIQRLRMPSPLVSTSR